MLRRISRFGLAFLFTVGMVWGARAFGISKDYDQKFPLQPGGTFELQNVNGAVEVQGWDRNEVEVHAVKTAKQRESDLDRVSIDVEAKPGVVSVSTRYPQDEGVEVAVEYTIHVPHCAHLERVATVNGTLRVTDVENIEELRTVNGNIDVFEGAGALHAHTTNGNIHVEMAHATAKNGMVAEAMNGSVMLALPSDTQADLETKCLNGSFYSELPVKMESTLNPREMHGRIGNGGPSIRLRTVNGGIRIAVYRSTV
jgi:Putative adhesin